jgi:two-component system, OmpR family, sensor histidine kinase BaeS
MKRTLAFKLTLAFLFVGALGTVSVALFLARQTRSQFDQFLSDSYEESLVERLADYYAANGSWAGASPRLLNLARQGQGQGQGQGHMGMMERPLPWILADENGRVVLGASRYLIGQQLDPRLLSQAAPIIVEGRTSGWLVQIPVTAASQAAQTPESDFLTGINRAILFSSMVAIAIALVFGGLLAQTISHPVRQLTEATTAVAQGELGRQVDVRTGDEIGELAAAFNQMSRDLDVASRQRRQMTADIAHELRTPLSIILGYTESLRDGVLPPDDETFAILHDEAQHLSRLVQDLRTLSLADAGELALLREPVSPANLLHAVAAKFGHQAQQKNVSLHLEIQPGLPEVEVDPRRMEQVLSNLLSNAFRFTPVGGQIMVTAVQANPHLLQIIVRDSGPGIPPEAIGRVFDRFYKADSSRPADEGESGLGLAIARSLVLMHGGSIRAESTPGPGATFIVELPL